MFIYSIRYCKFFFKIHDISSPSYSAMFLISHMIPSGPVGLKSN